METEDLEIEEEECGHNVVVVDGVEQHHCIPDDSAPHTPSSECGCGPTADNINGIILYEHVDQDR